MGRPQLNALRIYLESDYEVISLSFEGISNAGFESEHPFDDCPWDQTATPFDIAAEFSVDMSLSEKGIKGMLDEYEADHKTGMDTAAIAKQIREYTNGYITEKNTLFDSIMGKIKDYDKLREC